MLHKKKLKINIRQTSLKDNFANILKEYEKDITSEKKTSSSSINLWFINSHTPDKLLKNISTNSFNLLVYFCDNVIISEKLLKLFPYGTVHLLSNYWAKNDIEKRIKEIIDELSDVSYYIEPSSISMNDFQDSSLVIYLNQIAKKIANSDSTILILDKDNAEYGLGFLLFNIIKSKYLPELEYSDSLEIPFQSIISSKKFVACQSKKFLEFIETYQLPASYIYYIKNVNTADYEKNSEASQKAILLPDLSEFRNSSEIVIDFLSNYLIKEPIIFTKKAFSTLIKNSYNFYFSDFENILKDIFQSNIRLITESILMLFLEGCEKKLPNDFAFYFKQILNYNCIEWKSGNVYEKASSVVKQMLIKNALELSNGHKKNAAKILGINRNRLTNNRSFYSID